MNKKVLSPILKEKIREEANNLCKICGRWCTPGEPHHVIRLSQEPLLRNCKTNIWWLCRECHHKTENEVGFNKELQKQLQHYYYNLFTLNLIYTKSEIKKMVNIPMEDLEKAISKNLLKSSYGIDIIDFLLGGKRY